MSNLGLKVRDITQVLDSKAHYSPRHIEKWIKRLPMANTGEVARQVYETLVELNTTGVPVPDRFKILSQLTPAIEYITQYLSRHYRSNAVSLNDKQKKIASLAQAMENELAVGYKHILNELISTRDKKQMSKFLVPSLVKILHCFYLIMQRCYLLYTKAPNGLWREIHTIYQFAYNNRLTAQAAEFDSIDPRCSSVEQIYKLLLLLSLSNPYQMRQKDILLLSKGLLILVDLCQVMPVCDDDSEFAVVFGSDMPPVHRSIIKKDTAGVCSIDLTACQDHLKQELRAEPMLAGLDSESLTDAVGKSVLKHLLRAWGDMKSRAFKRTALVSSSQIAIGLSTTHFMLNTEYLQFEDSDSQKPETSGAIYQNSLENATLVGDDNPPTMQTIQTKKLHVPDDDGPDLWSQMFKGKDQVGKSIHQSEQQRRVDELNEGKAKAKAKYKSVKGNIINMSPGGYCLQLNSDIPHQTQTGEIVGICESEDLKPDSHWNIGSIRWMKRTANNQLQLGVQLIAPNAIPVNCRVKESSNKKMQRALMLPALKGIGQPATLLTNPLGYKVKDIILLQESIHTYEARLVKLIASTPSYKQFQFERLSKLEIKKEKENKDDDDNFNGLWEII